MNERVRARVLMESCGVYVMEAYGPEGVLPLVKLGMVTDQAVINRQRQIEGSGPLDLRVTAFVSLATAAEARSFETYLHRRFKRLRYYRRTAIRTEWFSLTHDDLIADSWQELLDSLHSEWRAS